MMEGTAPSVEKIANELHTITPFENGAEPPTFAVFCLPNPDAILCTCPVELLCKFFLSTNYYYSKSLRAQYFDLFTDYLKHEKLRQVQRNSTGYD